MQLLLLYSRIFRSRAESHAQAVIYQGVYIETFQCLSSRSIQPSETQQVTFDPPEKKACIDKETERNMTVKKKSKKPSGRLKEGTVVKAVVVGLRHGSRDSLLVKRRTRGRKVASSNPGSVCMGL